MAVNETRSDYAAHPYAIHHEGIRRGVQSASRTRVGEIREDMPWVHTAIAPLNGQRIPIDQDLLLGRWAEADLTVRLRRESVRASASDNAEEVRTGPRYPDDYLRLIDELIALGVMRRRKDDRIDLPDVYRIAFSIGRKGGVPKVQSGNRLASLCLPTLAPLTSGRGSARRAGRARAVYRGRAGEVRRFPGLTRRFARLLVTPQPEKQKNPR
ncbi:hypothetical protein [Streptomyces sp. x-80]|uniref:hypothetical protein n=1 Tax=Streptomyces sp. x-80 TaxID=2789282 RepID=UPI00397F3D02